MNEGLFPPVIVTTAIKDLICRGKAISNDIEKNEKTNLASAVELGQIVNQLIADCPHGQLLKSYEEMGLKQQRASDYSRVAKLPAPVLSKCDSIADALEAVQDQPEPKAKADNPDWCPRCNRFGVQTFGCEACSRVKEENHQKAKKKPKSSGRQAQSSAQPADDRPQQPKEQPPEEPIARKVFYSKRGLRKLLTKLRYAKQFPADETNRALEAFAEGFEITDRLAAAPHRPPGNAKCKKCGQDILWMTTENWSRVSFQPEPEIGGNYERIDDVAVEVQRDRGSGVKLYKKHFKSCFPPSKEPVFKEAE